MCNFETLIPVCQNQRSCKEQDPSLCNSCSVSSCTLVGPAALLPAWGQLWNGQQPSSTHTNPGIDESLVPPFSWTMMGSAEYLRGAFFHLRVSQLCPGSRGSPEERHLLLLQPGSGSAVWTEAAEMESAVSLRKPGVSRSPADFKSSV